VNDRKIYKNLCRIDTVEYEELLTIVEAKINNKTRYNIAKITVRR